MQSDVDELVRREALEVLKLCYFHPQRQFPVVFDLRYNWYSFDIVHRSIWYAPRVRIFNVSSDVFARNMGPTRHGFAVRILRAGWHCSWCLPLNGIIQKLSTFSHPELDHPRFKRRKYIQSKICRAEAFVHGSNAKLNNIRMRKIFLTPGNRDLQNADIPMFVIRNATRLAYLLPRKCSRSR